MTRIHTPLTERLGIDVPIILGGMMGISNANLAAAVSDAGGLGTISSATFGPDGTRQEIERIKELTDKPFSVNLPIFHPMVPGLIDILIELDVPVVTTSAGSAEKYTRRLKDAGITVLHVVSSLRTALKARDAGVDIIVAEGVESGGKVSPDEVPTISLIPQVVDAVDIPVVAAGGLAEGRGLLAALALGAVGVQLGTRFLACTEADLAHENWKKALIRAGDDATGIACRKSSPTRLIKNRFFEELDAADEPGKKAMHYMPLQAQGMARIATDGDGTTGNYVAGTGAGLIHDVRPAAEIVADIVETAAARLEQVQDMFDSA